MPSGSHGELTDESEDLRGSRSGQIEELTGHLPGGTQENHEDLQSR
jgi:hypothetical protein